jgi:hypothetical protein
MSAEVKKEIQLQIAHVLLTWKNTSSGDRSCMILVVRSEAWCARLVVNLYADRLGNPNIRSQRFRGVVGWELRTATCSHWPKRNSPQRSPSWKGRSECQGEVRLVVCELLDFALHRIRTCGSVVDRAGILHSQLACITRGAREVSVVNLDPFMRTMPSVLITACIFRTVLQHK